MVIFDTLQDQTLLRLLADGAVGVIPTDTVYGLVARADNPQAVQKLYALKHRERKPGTTIAADASQLVALGLPPAAVRQAARLWPNPLSVVMPLGSELAYLHAGIGSAPFRVVASDQLGRFLRQSGPLLTSSANLPGMPPAASLAEAQRYFGGQVDFYVDGGVLDNEPSTIVRLDGDKVEIIREGALPAAKVRSLL